MQDDKREYTPPVLEFMGTIRSLTRTDDVMGSAATSEADVDFGTGDLADQE